MNDQQYVRIIAVTSIMRGGKSTLHNSDTGTECTCDYLQSHSPAALGVAMTSYSTVVPLKKCSYVSVDDDVRTVVDRTYCCRSYSTTSTVVVFYTFFPDLTLRSKNLRVRRTRIILYEQKQGGGLARSHPWCCIRPGRKQYSFF